jgi:hypothetical protein
MLELFIYPPTRRSVLLSVYLSVCLSVGIGVFYLTALSEGQAAQHSMLGSTSAGEPQVLREEVGLPWLQIASATSCWAEQDGGWQAVQALHRPTFHIVTSRSEPACRKAAGSVIHRIKNDCVIKSIPVTCKNATTKLAYRFHSCGCLTHWSQRGVNFVISLGVLPQVRV